MKACIGEPAFCTAELSTCYRSLFFLILDQELGKEVGRLTRVGQVSQSGCFHAWCTQSPLERKRQGRRKGQSSEFLYRTSLHSRALQGKRNSGPSPPSSKHSRGLSGEEGCHRLTQQQPGIGCDGLGVILSSPCPDLTVLPKAQPPVPTLLGGTADSRPQQ